MLAELMQDRHYAPNAKEGNLRFLRTDRAFDTCMEITYKKCGWVQKKRG